MGPCICLDEKIKYFETLEIIQYLSWYLKEPWKRFWPPRNRVNFHSALMPNDASALFRISSQIVSGAPRHNVQTKRCGYEYCPC